MNILRIKYILFIINGFNRTNITPITPSISGEESSSSSKPMLQKRQFSQTQSEPETSEPPPSAAFSVSHLDRSVTFTEPRIKVIPPSTPTVVAPPTVTATGRSTTTSGSSRAGLLMHMHTEYASITDELESVCGLLSPPRSPGLLSPPRPPEQSPPSKWSRCLF